MEASLTSASDISKEIKRLLQSQDGHDGPTLASRKRPVSLPLLVDAANLDKLRRIFAKLVASSEFSIATPKSGASQVGSSAGLMAQQKWNRWLRKQHDVFLQQLISAVRHGRRSSLRTFLGVIASTPDDSNSSNNNSVEATPKFMMSQRLVVLLVQALISPYSKENESFKPGDHREAKRRKKTTDTIHDTHENNEKTRINASQSLDDDTEPWEIDHAPVGPIDEGVVQLLEQEFLQPYCDARYFTLTTIRHVAHILYRQQQEMMKKTTDDDLIGIKVDNLLQILLKIPISPSHSLLEPKMSKQGLCSNYLFSPPSPISEEDEERNVPWKDEKQDDDDNDSSDSNEDHPVQGNILDKSKNNPVKKISKPSWQTFSQHKLALQQAYLAVLKIPNIRPRTLQQILTYLPTHVLPNISSPLRFADFCTRAYEVGGMTSILALQSLFILMMDHGLEYPHFYASLYKLIEPKIFYAKFRTRFFQLLTKCLYSNPILPAYVVAAFMKRLCLCALSAPPSGSLYVIALVSNLLRKHPECACLIHRGGVDGTSEKLQDPFDSKADDPILTRAIESSLWELVVLEKHYFHAVATMAKACGTEGRDTLMYDMDEFVQHGYKGLFEQEKSRVGKRSSAPLTFTEPKGLFDQDDVFHGIFNVPVGE